MATLLEDVGTNTLSHLDYVGSLNIQWWATLRAMGSALPFVGNRYRWKESVHQMLQIGVGAFPMVALMAICSGFILALQGASELRRFGALHFVIDLVAVGFTRELGALLNCHCRQRTFRFCLCRRDRNHEGDRDYPQIPRRSGKRPRQHCRVS